MTSVGKQLYCGTKMRLNSFKFWFYSSFHSCLNTAAHPSLIFHSIMYLLPSQIGLISITLPQNWINSILTSLPDPHWQSCFSQSQKNVWRGPLLKVLWLSLLLSCSGVFYNIHFISHTPSNSFPRQNEFPSSQSEHRDYGKLQATKPITEEDCGIRSHGCSSHHDAC